jgi:hypothetical protein
MAIAKRNETSDGGTVLPPQAAALVKRALAGEVVKGPKLRLPPRPVPVPGDVAVALNRSALEVFDIPIELLIDSPENPNEQDEATFDQLVQGIKEEGIDEPCIVVPQFSGPHVGKFMIVSGHHRKKGGVVAGLKVIPCVLKKGWTEDKRKIELVRRNLLKGETNPAKFTHLFNEMVRHGKDRSILRQQMGVIKDDLFKKLYKQVEASLSPGQRKKLVEAKDRVHSVESFSAVLNDIFKNHGTELDHGILCFKYGDGKKNNVWYIKCDADLDKQLKALQEDIQSKGLHAGDVFKALLKDADLSKVRKSDKVAAAIEARKK